MPTRTAVGMPPNFAATKSAMHPMGLRVDHTALDLSMPGRYPCPFESSNECERARPPVQSSAIRHYCGLFGIFGDPDAVDMTYYALYAQQGFFGCKSAPGKM